MEAKKITKVWVLEQKGQIVNIYSSEAIAKEWLAYYRNKYPKLSKWEYTGVDIVDTTPKDHLWTQTGTNNK